MTRWIKKFKKPLFTCSGNHDIEELDNEEWLNKIDTSNYYPDNSIRTIENIKNEKEDLKTLSNNKSHRIGVIHLDIKQFEKKYDDKNKEKKANFSYNLINKAEQKFINNIKNALE